MNKMRELILNSWPQYLHSYFFSSISCVVLCNMIRQLFKTKCMKKMLLDGSTCLFLLLCYSTPHSPYCAGVPDGLASYAPGPLPHHRHESSSCRGGGTQTWVKTLILLYECWQTILTDLWMLLGSALKEHVRNKHHPEESIMIIQPNISLNLQSTKKFDPIFKLKE